MEWTIYTTIVTVISVVVGLAIHHFSIYVIEHGGLRSWRNARFETRLHKTATPQMHLSAPEGVVAAKNVHCAYQRNDAKGTVHVVIEGDFDEYDVRSLL